MKVRILLGLFIALVASRGATQTWTNQLGLQGGLLRLKPAGTRRHDYIDRWQVPNNGSTVPDLFVVLALTHRVALESGLAASHEKFREASGLIPASSASEIRLTLRADILITGGAYLAAGAMLRRRHVDASHSTQTGLLAALGYQRSIGSSLGFRLEGQWLTQRKTDSIAPSNVYAILVGISRELKSAARSPAGSTPYAAWRLQVGAAGGYVRNHLHGTLAGFYLDARETVIELPGTGQTTPAPLFVDVPVHGRLALELGFGAQRTQEAGSTLFDGHLAPRLNVAVYRGLYAGAGGNLRYVEQTGAKGFAVAGAHVAAGYRSKLTNALEGRLDVSFTAFKQRTNFPFAQNSLAALLGVAVALR